MVKDGIFLGKRYEVLSKIGAGGMADVYKGRDIMLNRYVAIKVLKKAYRADDSFVQKFRSEAQAAAGLLDPNIVNVYDAGEDRGLYYMVMELVEGITLKEYVEKKGRLSHREAVSIAIQVCSGIKAAHAAGIIHRDIKPHNIIISRDGKVKVTDFGIAKAITSNTVTFNAMGSVHYSSPEQVRGGYSDQKSDIYSIGITLFEMVTGSLPFDGDSTVSVAMQHIQDEIPVPSDLVSGVPYSLERIILKCTQKNAERRYKSTEELIQDLKHSLVDPEGNFVYIPPLESAQTIMISDEELDDIKKSYIDGDEDDEEDYDTGIIEDYDDEDYDKEYARKKERSADEVNPRMNKVIKVMTIVAAILIALILIFVIGKAAGIFKSFPAIDSSETESKVKVPNVVGMTEEDAKTALNKKGLGIKVVERKESTKYEAGVVSKQKTEAGKRVKKNTTIEVTVSSGLVGEEITVPDVSGMSEEEAQKALQNAGFQKVSSEYVYSDSAAEGEVIETTPAVGSKATKDTTIVLKISKGGEKKSVPNVEGTQVATAQETLFNAGLTVGTITYEYSSKVAKGMVISQSVKSGKKVASGTSVDLVVSDGEEPAEQVTIPPITNTSLENAKQLLSANGLKTGTVTYSNSDYPAGYVISCSPGEGAVVDEGTSINLEVSKGPASSGTQNSN